MKRRANHEEKVICTLLTLAAFLVFLGAANADLYTIGTALTTDGKIYNLIYEDDQELVWLDYTIHNRDLMYAIDWALSIGGYMAEINLFPGYTTTIDWTIGWRLPSDKGVFSVDFNQRDTELGHLHYESFGKKAGESLVDTGLFENLFPVAYWYGLDSEYPAEIFSFYDGGQSSNASVAYAGIAVHPGEVVYSASVPEPTTIILLGTGLIGLAGIGRKKYRKKSSIILRCIGEVKFIIQRSVIVSSHIAQRSLSVSILHLFYRIIT